MHRLAALIYTMAGATFAGVGVVAVLVAGQDDARAIAMAAAAGAVLAIPVTGLVARAIVRRTPPRA